MAGYPRAHLPAAALLGAVAGLLLVGRRRLPLLDCLLVFCAIQAVIAVAPRFQGASVFLPVAFLVSLYSLGRHARGVEAWLAVPLLIGSVVLLVADNGGPTPGDVVFFVLFDGLPWAVGLAVRLRLDRLDDLRAQAEALEQQTRRAVADERARIARELHDVVSHAIAVTVLQARGSRRFVGRDDEAVRQSLAAVEGTNVAALADMQRLLAVLLDTETREPPRADDPRPGLDRLSDLVETVRAAGVTVHLTVEGDRSVVTPGVDLSAFRIAQEALTNVMKHGGHGATATVRLRCTPAALELDVDSTVTGDRPGRPPGGHGLAGARERAAVLGGSVEAGAVPGGWRVRAILPVLPVAAVRA